MKKFLLALTVLSSLIFISCGDDEDVSPQVVGLTGSVTFNGQSYTITNGVINELSNAAGTELQFLMADGTVSSSGSSSDSQIIISARAISEGTGSLENGSYEVNRQVTSKYAYVTVTTASSPNIQSIVGGTIDISGSDNTFSLKFNNVAFFGGGAELNGTVSGTFGN